VLTNVVPPGTFATAALRVENGQATVRRELLAEEVPLALVYNGISHAVMMGTPLDLEDFALGFSLTEGILESPSELLDFEVREEGEGLALEMQILESRFQPLKTRRRALTGRTGCGLCGLESIEAAMRPAQAVLSKERYSADQLAAALSRLVEAQELNAVTGATHAAGLLRGDRLIVREDVGRHNALDKVIGAAAGEAGEGGVLLISSRASYEMAHKAAAAGVSVLVAVSAPTALAVRVAERAGVSLLGFARESRFTIYSQPEQVSLA
jgi:formate dehydrogenase accessory protein FdhD